MSEYSRALTAYTATATGGHPRKADIIALSKTRFSTAAEFFASTSISVGDFPDGTAITADAEGIAWAINQASANPHVTVNGVKYHVQPLLGPSIPEYPIGGWNVDNTGATDCSPQVTAAFEAIKTVNTATQYNLAGAGALNMPKASLAFGAGKYLLASKVLVDDIRAASVKGYNCVITGSYSNDFLFEFTGVVGNLKIAGINFEITAVGGVRVAADNISSHRVEFLENRFIVDAAKAATGIAIQYDNQSSQLFVTNNYFNRVKHPLHNINCDHVTFQKNWLGFAANASYDAGDGYIRHDKGSLEISGDLFAGGPSWPFTGVKVDGAGVAVPQYREVAYIRAGIPAKDVVTGYQWTASSSGTAEYYLQAAGGGQPIDALPPTQNAGDIGPPSLQENGAWLDKAAAGSLTAGKWAYGDNDSLGYNTVYARLSDNTDPDTKTAGYLRLGQLAPFEQACHVTISGGTRIGYELGAGPLINWHAPNVGETGAHTRSGFTINNIHTSVREDKEDSISGLSVAPLVRLYDMPHAMLFEDVHNGTGNLALITAGGTTTLGHLRARVSEDYSVYEDPAQQIAANGSYYFSAKGITAPALHMVVGTPTPTEAENGKWLDLFGAYDFFCPARDDTGAVITTGEASSSNRSAVYMHTIFDGFGSDARGGVFEVFGGVKPALDTNGLASQSVFGHVSVGADKNSTDGDALFARFQSAIDTAAVVPAAEVTAGFIVGSTFVDHVDVANANGAVLAIRVRHGGNPGVAAVRCFGLYVKPVQDRWARKRSQKFVQSFRN